MRLLLIRHGQTPDNVLGQLGTVRPGPGLTDLGRQQAAMIPDALLGDSVDVIAASTLLRTQLTAEPLALARALDVRVLGGLHEIEAGGLEGRSDRDAVRAYLETAFAWGSGALDVAMPGGSDGHAFFDRFDSDVASLEATAQTAVVFSHGAAIRVWTAGRATNVPPEFAGTHSLDNTGVVELNGSMRDGWTLVAWAGMPIGGSVLADATADDPTGESLDEVER
jgi:broad specificity phosphatase PhoE